MGRKHSGDGLTFAERLRDLRKGVGLTLVQLSDEVERETGVRISDVSLGRYENTAGNHDVKASNLMALADFFNISCDELLRGVKPKNIQINKRIGLSDKVIDRLEMYEKYNQSSELYVHDDGEEVTIVDYSHHTKVLNLLLENEDETGVLSNIVKLMLGPNEFVTLVSHNYQESLSRDDMDGFRLASIQKGLLRVKDKVE